MHLAPTQNEQFVKAALAASDDCIKIVGLDGSLLFMSDGGQRVMEVDDFDLFKGCPWPDFWAGQGREDALAALSSARDGRGARFTGFAKTAKGRMRYWDVKVSPIFNDTGEVSGILSVSRDITLNKEFEEQQILLRQELSHRIKNILSLVQAAANQTLRVGEDMARSKAALMSRLQSLGRAHDILLQTDHHLATLQAIVEAAFEGQAKARFFIEGPHVDLSPKCGLALALTFHELVTNAIKYGALSGESGMVNVNWTTREQPDGDRLELTWSESGGPLVAEPSHKGFGTKMISRALSGYIDGEVDLQFEERGLRFRMTASLDALKKAPARI